MAALTGPQQPASEGQQPLGRTTWLPLGFVVLSLIALLAVPVAVQRRTEAIRSAVVEVHEPARSEVNVMILALGREAGAIRSFVSTGDPVWLQRFREADTNFSAAADNIRGLVQNREPQVLEPLATAERAYGEWRVDVDALLRGDIDRSDYALQLVEDAAQVDATLLAIQQLEQVLVESQARIRLAANRTARAGAFLTALLSVLALASAILVVRIGGRLARLIGLERQARGEAERRAREERALSTAIAAVAASHTEAEVIERLARFAVDATDASGALVTRIHLDVTELEVVAVAGDRVPRIGERMSYPGSYAERVVARGEPELIAHLAQASGFLPDPIIGLCPECSAVLVPLVNAGEAIGALILIGAADGEPFRADQVQRAHAFGNLAAIAIRKVHLLEDSENRREALVRSMESRARLMRGFSHDVKNPLGAADGYLQLLEDGIMGQPTPKQGEGLARARRSIQSAIDLIDELLELARAESAEIELERVPADVVAATREIAEEYRAQAEAKGLEMEVLLGDRVPLIQSDPSRIRQVLGNLLSNAVKFTDHGRIVVKVGTAGRAPAGDGPWVTVQVSDTGPGIDPAKHQLIFDEFARGDAGTRPGVGVGLAFSKRICDALGGDLTVESRPGAGATFTVWLPVSTESASSERSPAA